MAAKKTFDLSSLLGEASKLNTEGGSVQMIPVAEIQSHEKNFYDTSQVDGLVDAILMDGLQSPVVVNRRGEGQYTIISGHRRFAALQSIMEAGLSVTEGKLFAEEIAKGSVPCLVNHYANELQAELALIRANSDTRVLTSAEIAQQVARVEQLFYELKEQGYSFPGKMRDNVAEACQVSASKIARLKVIQNGLAPRFQALYQGNSLRESPAYALAKMPQEQQAEIYGIMDKLKRLPYLQEHTVESCGKLLENLAQMKCKKDKTKGCDNHRKRLEKCMSSGYYSSCHATCCGTCSLLASCRGACDKYADKVKELKVNTKEIRKQERISKEEREAPDIAAIRAIWERFGEARRSAGKTVAETFSVLNRYFGERAEAEFLDMEAGGGKVTVSTDLPFGYNYSLSDATRLTRAAEALGCSVDFLLCRTDEPNGAIAPRWGVGSCPQNVWLVVEYRFEEADTKLHRQLLYSDHCGALRFSELGELFSGVVIEAWFVVPDRDSHGPA